MSETAQVALAVVCLLVSLLTELTALTLLIRESRRTGAALRAWRDRSGDAGLLVDVLLGSQFDRASALVLLVVGVLTGALGSGLVLLVAR
jgi:hypothetical protein